ncbi:hypothetical protein [Mycobacteroides abscessus]|uniref:hypothetical protein n=1 Tax=Mycobacteroides abscessus TaxID=36809 RepID=UPI00105741D2|nr:hypothetical protein [Mycobacteroides abscessus]
MVDYVLDPNEWVLNFSYDHPPDGPGVKPAERRVFFILEDWFWIRGGRFKRVLKAFRPNLKYPNIILVPEQYMIDAKDLPGDYLGREVDVHNVSNESVKKRTGWLRHTCIAFARGDAGYYGRKINEYCNNAQRFPTYEEVKDGSWHSGEGWFAYCDENGVPLKTQRGDGVLPRFGSDLTMAPSQVGLKRYNFHGVYSYGRDTTGIGSPCTTGFTPECLARVHPTDAKPQGYLVPPAGPLYHERLHKVRAQRGARLSGRSVPRNLPYPFQKIPPRDIAVEEIITAGDTSYDRSADFAALIEQVRQGRAAVYDLVKNDPAISERRKREFYDFYNATKSRVEEDLRTLEFIDERDVVFDTLTCPVERGGYGLSSDEAKLRIRDHYLDVHLKEFSVGGISSFYSPVFLADDPDAYPDLEVVELPNICGTTSILV